MKIFIFTYPHPEPHPKTGKPVTVIAQVYARNVRRAAENLALISGVPEYKFSLYGPGSQKTGNPLSWEITP